MFMVIIRRSSNKNLWTLSEGRFINYNDIDNKRKVAIIGQGVKRSLYDIGEDVMGTYIKINGVNFMVIGTYEKKTSGGDSEEESKQIYVPFTAFSQAFNRGDKVGWMAITAMDGTPITDIKEQIFDIVKKNHKIHPEDNVRLDILICMNSLAGLSAYSQP